MKEMRSRCILLCRTVGFLYCLVRLFNLSQIWLKVRSKVFLQLIKSSVLKFSGFSIFFSRFFTHLRMPSPFYSFTQSTIFSTSFEFTFFWSFMFPFHFFLGVVFFAEQSMLSNVLAFLKPKKSISLRRTSKRRRKTGQS